MMRSLKTTLVLSIFTGALLLSNIAQPASVSANFRWEGDAGYKAEGIFTYNDSFTLINAEGQGNGNFNHGLEYLTISFYTPSGIPMYSVVNVLNSAISYQYFDFTYDPQANLILGTFEAGFPAVAANSWQGLILRGVVGGSYPSGISDNSHDPDVDQQAAGTTIEVHPAPVPIPAAFWLFGSGLLGLIGFSKRKKAA